MGSRVLLICKESFSFPLYFVAKELMENNEIVASYFFNSIETAYNKCLMNENTYFKHKELEGLKVYDNNNLLDTFTQNKSNPPTDYDYIDWVNENFTKSKTLPLQILTSQFFSRYFHDRFFFEKVSYEQQMYWLELNYKRVLEIFEEFSPDMVWDLDNSELSRSIIAEVANKRGVPYTTIDHTRYEKFKIPSFSTIFKNDAFYNVYSANRDKKKLDLIREYEYVNEFRGRERIMSQVFIGDKTSDYSRPSLSFILKYILSKLLYVLNISFVGKNYRLQTANNIIFPSNIKLLWFFVKSIIKRWWLLGQNHLFSPPDLSFRYIYMPLHLIPESSTSVLAPYYINELASIEQVSKSLPLGYYLYVKEHQSMLGERPLRFYRKVKQLPNVRLVSVNHFVDPKPLIVGSCGVITVTGSAAYEAAMLGKRAIVFGDVSFGVIDGISRVRSYEDLAPEIDIMIKDSVLDNVHSCAAYIASVSFMGSEIDLKYLMREGERILSGRVNESDSFQREIKSLCDFFYRAAKNFKPGY